MSWIDKFFENNSWLNIARLNSNDELIDSSGAVISGVAAYTLSQFKAGGFDLTTARHVIITDVYSDTDSQPSLWYVQPTASTQKRKLVSPYVVYSTFPLLITDFPAASYPGLRALITGFGGSSGILVKSNGTRYVPVNGSAWLFGDTYGTIAAPTLNAGAGSTSFTFSIGTPSIPANILAVDDKLIWTFRMQRHNANATMTPKVCIGTAGTTSDASVWSASLAATDVLICNALIHSYVSAATSICSNVSAALTGTGGTTSASESTTNFNIASDMTITIGGTKNTSDTLDLLEWSVEWVAK